jgi:hypothetical protein
MTILEIRHRVGGNRLVSEGHGGASLLDGGEGEGVALPLVSQAPLRETVAD